MNTIKEIKRRIGVMDSGVPGPTLVIMACIHGNEKSGIKALNTLFDQLSGRLVKGCVIGLMGNIPAFKKGERYIDIDLNRIWPSASQSKNDKKLCEHYEQIEIENTIDEIFSSYNAPFVFIDLHTTSSKTDPFIIGTKTKKNIEFYKRFDLPAVVGVHHYIKGTFLESMSMLGHVSIAYESGQHDDASSVHNHVLFLKDVLHSLKMIKLKGLTFPKWSEVVNVFNRSKNELFEIRRVFKFDDADQFRMNPGYFNFKQIEKGELLAFCNDNAITASQNGRIFMPLYQAKGNEGFFEIGEIDSSSQGYLSF